MKVIEDSHSSELSHLEARIGDLERDLGKSASSLLKEKRTQKAKSSEVRHLQRQIQNEEGSKSRDVAVADDASRAEFRACLTKIASSLDSLMDVHLRDLALASIEGGVREVRLFMGEEVPSPQATEAKLTALKEKLVAIGGDCDSIFAGLKSECALLPCPDEPKGQGLAVERSGDDAVPGSNEMRSEGECDVPALGDD